MGLTFLFDDKCQKLGIVKWFRDISYNICYPDGPLVERTFEEFRESGAEFVRKHFELYRVRRVREVECVSPLPEPALKEYLKRSVPIEIIQNSATGEFTVSPLRFKRYSLGYLEVADKNSERKLSPSFTDSEFQEAIDTALRALR